MRQSYYSPPHRLRPPRRPPFISSLIPVFNPPEEKPYPEYERVREIIGNLLDEKSELETEVKEWRARVEEIESREERVAIGEERVSRCEIIVNKMARMFRHYCKNHPMGKIYYEFIDVFWK